MGSPLSNYSLSVAGMLAWALGVSIWTGIYRRVLILSFEQSQPSMHNHGLVVTWKHLNSSVVLGLLCELLMIRVLRKDPRFDSTRWTAFLFLGTQITWLIPDPWGEPMAGINGLVIAILGVLFLAVPFWKRGSVIEIFLATMLSMEFVLVGMHRLLWYYSITQLKSDFWLKKSTAMEAVLRGPICWAFVLAAFSIAGSAIWKRNRDWRYVIVYLLIGVHYVLWLILPLTL